MEDKENNKPIVIYHDACADGFAAAWVFWRKYKDEYEYFPGVYGSSILPNVKDRDVFLLDFSYPKQVMEQWVTEAKSITILDHHKTAIEELGQLFFEDGRIGGVLDNSRSGAMIAWDWLNPNIPAPALLQHIQDRDLWKFELEYTREIQNNLFSYEYDFELWNALMRMDVSHLVDGGIAITRKHNKDVAELLEKYTHMSSFAGYFVPCCNIPYMYSSEAASRMSKDHPFAFCYTYTKSGIMLSLRSQPDGADVSTIAKTYGGGGHKTAAGCKLNHDDVSWVDNIMYIRQK